MPASRAGKPSSASAIMRRQQLGDVVFAETPQVGKTLKQGDAAAVVESVKAASDVFAPVSGEVVAVNSEVETTPGLINEDAMGKGWLFASSWPIRASSTADGRGRLRRILKTFG